MSWSPKRTTEWARTARDCQPIQVLGLPEHDVAEDAKPPIPGLSTRLDLGQALLEGLRACMSFISQFPLEPRTAVSVVPRFEPSPTPLSLWQQLYCLLIFETSAPDPPDI